MENSPFTVHGDDTLEARIVAWVLGEASAFEAAELERLCEERPELLVFRRRMRALHGLLTEAEAAQPDESWKLPPEKRKALDEIFGDGNVVRLDPEKETRIRHSGRRAFLAIAACLVLTAVVFGLFGTGGLRRAEQWIAGQENRNIAESKESSMDRSRYLEELRKAVRDQEDKVEERRKVLATIVRTKGVVYKGTGSFYGQSGVDEDQGAKNALSTFHQLEQEKMQLESQVSSLLKYDNDQLMVYAGGLDLPNNIVRETFPRYQQAKRDLEALKIKGLGADHPTVKAAEEETSRMKRQIDEGIVDLRQTLKAKLDLATESLKSVEVAKNETREEAIKRGLDAQDYVDAKREFETDQEVLQKLKLKLIDEEISTRVSNQSLARNDSQSFGLLERESARAPHPRPVPSPELPSQTRAMAASSPAPSAAPVANQAEGAMRFDANEAKPATIQTTTGTAIAADAPAEADMDLAKLSTNGGSGGGLGDAALKADQPMEYAQKINDPEPYHLGIQADAGELSKQLQPPATALPSEAQPTSEMAMAGRVMSAEKKMKASEKMPVLGERMLADGSKSEGRALQIDGAAESNSGALVQSKSDSLFDTSKVADSKKPGGTEYEIHTGYSSEYLFKAKDLSNADASSPADKESSELAMAGEKGVKRELEEGGKVVSSRSRVTAAPKPDLTKLIEEIAATEDPYSTFSLNISDASFQVAQAALAKGERPDPAGIKVEQFYNAVDYGDPAPAAGEPVAVNIEQSAHPVIPGRNLVRVALKTAAAGRSAAQPLRLTLLVDQSGSMVREDRHAAMDKALAGLAGLLTEKDLVTVVGFSRTPRLIADGLTGDKAGKLAELVNQSASEGGTNLEEAIKLAGQMADRHKLAGAQNRIVLFTDGAANLGNADPAKLAENVKQLRQKGIAFDIAGIAAEDLNDDLLGELARNGNGRYYVVGKGGDDNFAKQLAGAFRPAAENVKVQVHFNPERVGRYKLIGFEKDRLKTEDFRNDAVDAAEMAAEEAGVAIYQVEPLADGKGELGEVSVRFRDTTAGEMVERTWTIRHEAAAPVFDRAAPSMQLATLAMLAAEKLKGGPLSDAIDFKQLAEPSANVKRFYGTTGRPGDVLRMVDALK